MNFLKKLQNQPVYIKKLIVWGVAIVLGIIFVVLWLLSSVKQLQSFQTNQFALFSASVQKETDKLKEIKLPEMNLGTEDAAALKELENPDTLATSGATE